ncbi:MAG TPA: PTS fructose transporter subunit IIA [Rubrivivax sp.]|nr:PTS fructose transporter subunit IIA [Rubrivivax sp.]
MTIVLIVAHAPLASSLKAVAEHAYCDVTVEVHALDVAADATADTVAAEARTCIERCGDVDVLVFADVFGATPCRGAMLLLSSPRVRVVAGVNVPMLWRTLCYGTDDPLDTLVARAIAGANQGVLAVAPPAADAPQPKGS